MGFLGLTYKWSLGMQGMREAVGVYGEPSSLRHCYPERASIRVLDADSVG